MSDSAALDALRHQLPTLGPPRISRFNAGRRTDPWQLNCVALGSAAMELEPLAGADLHFVQAGIVTLIELLPRTLASAAESHEYNRVMGEYADSVRDFTLAQYLCKAAAQEMTAPTPPPRLAHKLDLYAASGRIELLDFESFEETDWAWLLLGAARIPDSVELHTRTRLQKTRAEELLPLARQIEQLAASMPAHLAFVDRQRVARVPPRVS